MLSSAQSIFTQYTPKELIISSERGQIRKINREIQSQAFNYDLVDAEVTTRKPGRTVKLQVDEANIKKEVSALNKNEIAVNEDQLAKFLRKVYPMISDELEDNIKSLNYYQPQWNDERKENQCFLRITPGE